MLFISKILVILLFIRTLNALDLNSEGRSIILNSNIDDNFDFGYSVGLCYYTDGFEEAINVNKRKLEFSLSVNESIIIINSLNISSSSNVLDVKTDFKPFSLKQGEKYNIEIDYVCKKSDEQWALVYLDFEINQSILFKLSYVKICNDEYSFLFDYTILILLLVAFFYGLLARTSSVTKHQRNFKGFEINWQITSIFFILLTLIIITLNYSYSTFDVIYIVLFSAISTITMTIDCLDFISCLPEYLQCKISIKMPNMGKIYFKTVIAFMISVTLAITWAITKHFILTDLLTLSIAYFTFRLLKLKALKTSLPYLILITLFEIFWALLVNYAFSKNYAHYFSSEICLPLKIDIPSAFFYQKRVCSFISISDLIIPSLILSYFRRFDLSSRFNVYFPVGLGLYFLALAVWFLICLATGIILNTLIFVLPIVVLAIFILAYTRNENGDLWKGNFYDAQMSLEIEDKDRIIPKEVYEKEKLFEGLMSGAYSSKGIEEEQGKEEMKEDANKE